MISALAFLELKAGESLVSPGFKTHDTAVTRYVGKGTNGGIVLQP